MKKTTNLKLYVKVGCSICLGGNRQGVFSNCPYCDCDREQIIEASFNTIKDILKKGLNKKEKKELINFLNEK